MTLIQNFLITGIFAILVSLVVMAWAAIVRSEKERRPDPDFAVNPHAPGGWGFHSTFIWDNRRGDWHGIGKANKRFFRDQFSIRIL